MMETGTTFVERLGMRVTRLLVKRPVSPMIITGTLALAALGGAALNAAPEHGQPVPQNIIAPTDSTYPAGCYADPDGDGHIFCDPGTSISSLPASLGHCFTDADGDGRIICDGNQP